MIECRIDAAARGRFEKYSRSAAVRYPAVSDHKVQWAVRLDVEDGLSRLLKYTIFQNQSATAGEPDGARESQIRESHVTELRCLIGATPDQPRQVRPGRTIDLQSLVVAKDVGGGTRN